uniref:Mesothelin like n=1 Tax=Amazona collaria TaxID=241587 RepID=A0A8B9FVR7_9PSIT
MGHWELKRTVNATVSPQRSLSASLLHGFPCIPDNDLPAADILSESWNGLGWKGPRDHPVPAPLSQDPRGQEEPFAPFLPPALSLAPHSLSELHNGTCEAFYAQASHGNLELLPRGSVQRSGLLRGALTCLGVRSRRLRPEQLSSLGALVCDMEPETIPASDPGVLENLKLCSALTGAQRDAVNAVLLSGDTAYGDPSSWDLRTLQNLGSLVLALNETTFPVHSLELFQGLCRTRDRQEGGKRQPDAPSLPTGCLSEPITASTITDPFLIIDYDTSEQFGLCLSNEVLKENLSLVLEQPFPTSYLQVVKKKLDQIYPSGIPEEQLKLLGPLSRLYTAEEISRWRVTSSDTLSVLLNPSDGNTFLSLGGILTGPLLQQIGGQLLCNLQEKQIQQIPPEAIRTAGQLSISSCSQTKKDQLYRKAQEAFADLVGTPKAYYCRIRPYLGGAPAKDLKDLAAAGVAIDMDINTFLALNPKALQVDPWSTANLLGQNLPQLKAAENETSVMLWVKRQSQRELDCVLGIGLTGGLEEPGLTGGLEEPSPTGTATPPHPTTSAGRSLHGQAGADPACSWPGLILVCCCPQGILARQPHLHGALQPWNWLPPSLWALRSGKVHLKVAHHLA